LQLELRLTSGGMHVDVHASLLAREEVKAKGTIAENRRAHLGALYSRPPMAFPLLDTPPRLDLGEDVHEPLGWNVRFSDSVDLRDAVPERRSIRGRKIGEVT